MTSRLRWLIPKLRRQWIAIINDEETELPITNELEKAGRGVSAAAKEAVTDIFQGAAILTIPVVLPFALLMGFGCC